MSERGDTMIGRQLGNYVLLQLLGQGGFASVYLAENVHIKTKVAIKVLHTQITREEMEHFREEARTIAELRHPHIVQLLDFGVDAGSRTPYLIMSYAPNGSLRLRHRSGELVALPTVVAYVRQISGALQLAHDRRVVHRDVKPENVLLNEQNELVLSDFGIALVMHTSHQQSTKDITGTFAYMAPEQTQGKPAAASDQYALGVMAYEWLVGVRPFNGSMTELIAQHHVAPPPSLCAQNPAVPPAVEEVVLRALAKKAQDRFPQIREFAEALEQASRSAGQFSGAQLKPSPMNQAQSAPTLPPRSPVPLRDAPPFQVSIPLPPTEPDPELRPSPVNQPLPPTVAASLPPQAAQARSPRQAQPSASAPLPPVSYPPAPPYQSYYGSPAAYPPPQYIPMIPVPVKPQRRTSPWRVLMIIGIILLSSCCVFSGFIAVVSHLPKNTASSNAIIVPVALKADSKTLYLADWSKNLNHWSGGAEWKWIQNDLIGSDGGQSNQSFTYGMNITDLLSMAPYRPASADYEVDAQIQFVRSANGTQGDLGIVLRVDNSGDGYLCGFDVKEGQYDIELMQAGRGSITSLTQRSGTGSSMTMDNQYHTYQVKIQKNSITLFVDGHQVVQATDNTYLAAGAVGLRSYATVIDVHSFRVEKL